jgi:hypothetical protein
MVGEHSATDVDGQELCTVAVHIDLLTELSPSSGAINWAATHEIPSI